MLPGKKRKRREGNLGIEKKLEEYEVVMKKGQTEESAQ